MVGSDVRILYYCVVCYLSEVSLNVGLCRCEELEAAVEVSEGPDAEAVGGVQLGLEKLAARVPNICQLKQIGGREQRLDIILSHINLTSNIGNHDLRCEYHSTWLVYT